MLTCIRGGTLLLEKEELCGDLLMEDAHIVKFASNIEEAADINIDARGKYVLAGGVDEHTHYGSFQSRSFDTVKAAAVGGTTTIMDFVAQQPNESLQAALSRQIQAAKPYCYVNIGFHSMLMNINEETLQEIKELPAHYIHAIKMFMAYKGTPYYANHDQIRQAMLTCKETGMDMMLHAEDADLIKQQTELLLQQGRTSPYAHALAHHRQSEYKAVDEAINLAKETGVSLFFVHISTKEALALIKQAQRDGWPIGCETCTHYLVLDETYLQQPGLLGCRYICSPPLRTKMDQDALWKGIQEGSIEAVSSDHCAVFGGYQKKIAGYTDFLRVANGMPGVQNRLHLLWTFGVLTGQISKQQLVQVFSIGPAKRCHLKHKGRLLPGYDADIVIYDPAPVRIWRDEDSLEGIDYASYKGITIHGKVSYVWINGVLCVKDEIAQEIQAGKLLVSE